MKNKKLFLEMENMLYNLGFSIKNDSRKNIINISKLKIGANIGVFDAAYEAEFGYKPISFTERISSVTQKMKEALPNVIIDKKIYVLIDGVDDILRIKKDQLEILSSLIRSIDGLNEYFLINKINIKVILFIREDIVYNITDPDLNKIKRDGSIFLTWGDNLNDLKKIAELRFKISNPALINAWDSIFPYIMRNKNSWDFFIEHTLYKPRDILQFLTTCQELFPDNTTISRKEMSKCIKVYSKNYFQEEMKNEITGFIDDGLINTLPSIMQKIGASDFSYNTLLQVTNEQSPTKKYTEQQIKYLLLRLFEAGYIGQIVRNNKAKNSVIFKYRNTSAGIDYSQQFIIHRGLHKGLGVVL